MSRQCQSLASGEQPKAIVEAGRDLLNRQHINARGGELDSQWHAVQIATDLDHSRGLLFGKRQVGRDRRRPLQEQADRLGLEAWTALRHRE